MGRIGDIADLVTGLALLGGGYLIYRAVKDAGDIIPEGPGWPEWPTFEWPAFEWPTPSEPGEGGGPIPGPAAPGGITPPTWFEWPTFEWPTFPGFGGDEGLGGGGGGVRNGDNGTGLIVPDIVPLAQQLATRAHRDPRRKGSRMPRPKIGILRAIDAANAALRPSVAVDETAIRSMYLGYAAARRGDTL